MKRNVGGIDKALRILISIVIAVVYYMQLVTGTLAIALAVVGVVMLITALMSFCPLYRILGISSCGCCDHGKCAVKDTEEK